MGSISPAPQRFYTMVSTSAMVLYHGIYRLGVCVLPRSFTMVLPFYHALTGCRWEGEPVGRGPLVNLKAQDPGEFH